MKRSEMLNILEQFISDHDFGGKDSGVPYNKAANDLLSKIEELGMIPPIIIVYKDTDYFYNEWEPENES